MNSESHRRHKDGFQDNLALWVHHALGCWQESPTGFPEDLDRFTPEEQRDKESDIERTIERLSGAYERYDALTHGERAAIRNQIRSALLKSLFRSADAGSELFLKECERTAQEFVKAANAFDPSLPMEDVHQALRNQWVFNSIQRMFGLELTLTPSSFAYSLLYPFTDNMLDGDQHRKEHLELFLRWLSLRLEGTPTEPIGSLGEQVDRLLGMIEQQYPRTRFPFVFDSLAAIHRAQQRGLLLRSSSPVGEEADLLAITFTKGGTSVLVDGALVSGSLNDDLAQSVFFYGIALQLIDDLQDLQEDRTIRYSSPFTRAADHCSLDIPTNKLFHFVRTTVSNSLLRRNGQDSSVVELITRSCAYLMLEAIAQHRQFYTPDYLSRIQEHMPLRIDYLAGAKGRMTSLVSRMPSRACEVIQVA